MRLGVIFSAISLIIWGPQSNALRMPNTKQIKSCPSKYGWIQLGQNCYLVSTSGNSSWWQAQQFCADNGGWLAEIISPEEQTDVNTLLIPGGVYWIGLTDLAYEGRFIWQHSYKPLSGGWANWYPNEPNDAGSEDCVLMFNNGTTWAWNDSACSGSRHALCQF